VNWRLEYSVLSLACILVSSFVILLGPSVSYSQDSECASARAKWEQIFENLRAKLQEVSNIQQTPVERIIGRPIIERTGEKTIARQVADALQVKEDLLNNKRKECRTLMNFEAQAFGEFQDCIQRFRASKEKDGKNLGKKRQALLDKAIVILSEVKEVEGKEGVLPYSEAMHQDQYSRSVNNYWQNYQNMYRRWWGH